MPPLTLKQKSMLAAFGGLMVVQAGLITRLLAAGYQTANVADEFINIAAKNANVLDQDSLRKLQDIVKHFEKK